jgi:hypothetical protein
MGRAMSLLRRVLEVKRPHAASNVGPFEAGRTRRIVGYHRNASFYDPGVGGDLLLAEQLLGLFQNAKDVGIGIGIGVAR